MEREREESILGKLRAGDPRGGTELYEGFAPQVRGVLAKMVPRREVDDLVQEVFLRACSHIHTFRGESRLSRWLCCIARNLACMHLRRASLVQPLEIEAAAPGPGPEERAMESEDRGRAQEVLGRVDAGDRHILILREVLELSYEEIQQRLELNSVGTVRSRLHKAREELRRRWAQRSPPG